MEHILKDFHSQVIFTESNGRTVIEVWRDGRRVDEEAQVVKEGQFQDDQAASNDAKTYVTTCLSMHATGRLVESEKVFPWKVSVVKVAARLRTGVVLEKRLENCFNIFSFFCDSHGSCCAVLRCFSSDSPKPDLSLLRAAIRQGDKSEQFFFPPSTRKTKLGRSEENRQPKERLKEGDADELSLAARLRLKSQKQDRSVLMAVFESVASD